MDKEQSQGSSSAEPVDRFAREDANHQIDPDCEILLRKTKKQVKRLMEEAVTRKFIHIESGGLSCLCVAVDACLMHGLKRRVLGLFKTSSSMALVHKVAKSCPSAKHILQSVENYKLSLLAAEQQQQQINSQINNKHNDNSITKLQQQVQQPAVTSRRFIWIKFALIEAKLVDVIEYLGKNAGKFYEPNALMSDYLCAQILCSLLVGPSALEFSRHKVNEFQFQEDPTAYDLVKRHKLANPIACACKQKETIETNSCDNNNNNDKGLNKVQEFGRELESLHPCSSSITQLQQQNQNQQQQQQQQQQEKLSRSSSIKSKGGINRRRPLSIKTNANRPLLVTECHHYSCQEITEHKQLRGYSMSMTSQGPLSAPSPITQRTPTLGQPNQISSFNTLTNNSNKNTQQQQQNNNSTENNNNTSTKQSISIHANQHQQRQHADNSLSLWSPRMLHEIMHQNSRYRLLYAKNNILIENETNNFVPGYLSLHETNEDLILKWIPNQMINGSHCKEHFEKQVDRCEGNNNNENDHQQQQNYQNPSRNKNNNWDSIKDPTPVESSYLDLVVSIPISSIVLLHCHFRSSSIESMNSLVNDSRSGEETLESSKEDLLDQESVSCSEETLILVEADGIQRAPFRFPTGGLRLFLSCLETGLGPQRFLDPAISLDQSSQWPQHPLSRNDTNSDHQASSSGRSTPLAHSSSFGGDSKETTVVPATNDNNVAAPSSLGRFDSLLRRFPSLRRARQQRHSSSNEETARVLSGNDTKCREKQQGMSQMAATNNYIYRIVSVQQSDWPLPTPPDASSTGVSSPSYLNFTTNSNTNNNNRNLIRDLGNFRWNLRRWTNFARLDYQNSSTSTISSSFGQAQADDSPASDCNKLEQQTTIESGDLSQQSGSLMDSFHESTEHHALFDPNSLKLASIEAKLNDLKKSTSEEVLETFRAQSIETLCKSMRKQIVARAFYGWLVHCRRSKLIRKHLSHLLKLQHRKNQLDILAEHGASDDAYSSGLTRTIWEKLMNSLEREEEKEEKKEKEEQNEPPNGDLESKQYKAKLVAQKVSLYVYFGGIESNQLRKQVWPFLLKYRLYSDSTGDRLQKHAEARRAYDECATDWLVIEREVVRRDGEILAANIARAKRETSSRLKHQAHKQSDNIHISNPDAKKVLNVGSCDKEAQSAKSGLTNATGAETGSCLIVDSSISTNLDTNLNPSKPDATSTDKSTVDFSKKTNCDRADVDSEDNSNNTQNENETDDQVAQAELNANSSKSRVKRWRLESTGSVSSDAPITDQFGNNIHRIDKDVQRCDRNFWYFKDKKNLAKLRNIMCTYVWQNLKVGYVQGMCDLAAPFLVILDDEFEAYQCYNQLMIRMVDNFPLGSAMDKHFEALRYLLQVMDPKLFQILQCDNEDNSCFYFCYRWLLLDFKRELPYGDVYLVWETIWAARDVATDHFVVFLAFAMVRYYRDIIIENNMDYTDTLKFFNEMAERHDIRRILKLARESIAELYSMMTNC